MLPASETLSAENSDCALTVTATFTTTGVLQVHYQVRNTGSSALYFLNQLWKDIRRDTATNQQVFEVLPDLVNIEVHPTFVSIHKAVVDVPYGLLVEVRRIPCLVRVAAGATYEETLHLPLPLQAYTPYESEVPTGPILSLPIQLELGYLRDLPHIGQALEEVATPTGKVYWLPAFPAKQQSKISTDLFSTSVLVASHLYPYPPKPADTGKWTPWSS